MAQAKLRYFASHRTATLLAAVLLAACAAQETVTQSGVIVGNGLAPAGAAPGTCWGKIPTPAVIETVTEQILVTPAKTNPDGTLSALPVYREERRQQIVTPRTDRWFEIPCPPAFTIEFVSTLQRALQARGQYTGAVSGDMDDATRRAVLAVQTAGGLPSDVLSIETARELGIVAVPRTP
ncbi:peptidoglycan-binding domain-containing protein [Sulfitobacter guttiformis]|uniref:Putative peptidoglycan binding protein n=1 Tax=Sulfitobacter guttiformis TaxID=74349 RepID=A0A420DJQ9_9RHOB|nr:peptidoglycan-binding domain-containing protein [Sulfitobacter guttiformis]KIN71734.1 putative lipoprotein [Sulfitobacter guttiformis KCTC 32187]RKE94444.1 putative peptidoglycan binding protein [Sulfitobacter guttiformis]